MSFKVKGTVEGWIRMLIKLPERGIQTTFRHKIQTMIQTISDKIRELFCRLEIKAYGQIGTHRNNTDTIYNEVYKSLDRFEYKLT
jgi:hypothetical protein